MARRRLSDTPQHLQRAFVEFLPTLIVIEMHDSGSWNFEEIAEHFEISPEKARSLYNSHTRRKRKARQEKNYKTLREHVKLSVKKAA